MITDLAAMMVERLTAFKNKSKVLPTRVIVYRDGVSEVSVMMPFSGSLSDKSPRDNSKPSSERRCQR